MESVRIVLIASWSSCSLVMRFDLRCSPLSFNPDPAASPDVLGPGVLLKVPTELVAHGRKQLICKVCLASGAEPLVQGGGQDVTGHALVDRRLDRPAALAGIGHAPGE